MATTRDYIDADSVITDLYDRGHDYTEHREEIAEIIGEKLFKGEPDVVLDMVPEGSGGIRFVEGYLYDLGRDDSLPDRDSSICLSGQWYIFSND